jgi:hypothetical protein
MRTLKHLLVPDWIARRVFPEASLVNIERAIEASESKHRGELRFAIEGGLPLPHLMSRGTPRTRAEEVFSLLRVWDTEENSGVLIYVQLIDRDIEIVADRGVSAKVPTADWEAICRDMEAAFRDGRYEEGTLHAIERVSSLLAHAFPPRGGDRNELADRPAIL